MSCHLAINILNKVAFRRITYSSCLEYICHWRRNLSQNEKTRKRSVPTGQMEPSDRNAGTLDCTRCPGRALFATQSNVTLWLLLCTLPPPHHHNHHHQTNKALSLLLRTMHLSLQLVFVTLCKDLYTHHTLTQNLRTRSVANFEVMDPAWEMCSSV